MDTLKFTAIVIILVNTVFAQRSIQSECPSVFEFVNQTDDRWYGILNLRAASQMQGIQIDIVFDEAVAAFVNNFGLSKATDNRVFTIFDTERVLKPGDKIEILIVIKFSNPFKIPQITTIHLNGNRVCPDNGSNEDRSCIRFDTTSTTPGRWDGTLTIYPKFNQIGLKVTIELDGEAFVLGNDFGLIRTWNSKKFIIHSQKDVKSNERIKIKFFVKYSELEQVPDIKSISIDDQVYCVKDASIEITPVIPPRSPSITVKPSNNNEISFSELPVSQYPLIEQIPTEVDNKDFACGSSMSISNRVTNGEKGESGQFPFHAAVYINSLYKCGGSLINEKVVITAAHCIVDGTRVREKEVFRVVLGLINLRNLTGVEAIRMVAEVIKHPGYGLSRSIPQNDIGLLVLSGKIQYTNFITPICLFDSFTKIDELIGSKGLVLGWGLTLDNEISQHLNFAYMTFVSRRDCINSNLLFGVLSETSAYCAKPSDISQVVCSGDSGGGQVILKDGKFYLRGLVSVSITEAGQSCDVKQFVAFTDVSFYLKWDKIETQMKIVTDFHERKAL